MLLRLENVSKIYGSRLIFKSVSLALDHGQILLLTGSNGSGKSTLLRIMSGLAACSAGKVLHEFKSPAAQGPIGYMGHQTFIYPQLSAYENLRFWSRFYGRPGRAADIEKALERVELGPYRHERAGTFSRGMAQRLNLARILMQSPELLLLDEPATGLDARSKNMLVKEIRAAAEGGAGIVWISHSLAEDLPLANLVAALPEAPGEKRQQNRPGGAGRGLAFFGSAAEFQERLAGRPDGFSAGAEAPPAQTRCSQASRSQTGCSQTECSPASSSQVGPTQEGRA